MSKAEVIQKLKERLAQPDGKDVALKLMERIGLPQNTMEGLRNVSAGPLIDMLVTNLEAIGGDAFHEAAADAVDEPAAPLRAGVYAYKSGLYLLLGLARDHASGEERVAYIPLAVKPEWSGTARIALRTPEDFREHFHWVGERLP